MAARQSKNYHLPCSDLLQCFAAHQCCLARTWITRVTYLAVHCCMLVLSCRVLAADIHVGQQSHSDRTMDSGDAYLLEMLDAEVLRTEDEKPPEDCTSHAFRPWGRPFSQGPPEAARGLYIACFSPPSPQPQPPATAQLQRPFSHAIGNAFLVWEVRLPR